MIKPYTEEWFEARMGKVTGSIVGKILKGGKQRETLLSDKLEEIIIREYRTFRSQYTDRGIENEPAAIGAYEFERGIIVKPSYLYIANEWEACTPDAYVGDDGILEVKCPRIYTHLKYMRTGMPAEYMPQVQYDTRLTGRQWCDFISFCPYISDGKQLYVQRVMRDNVYCESMIEKVDAFIKDLKSLLDQGDQYYGRI